MQVLKLILKVVDAHPKSLILGPAVLDKDGKRVGQLVAEIVEFSGYEPETLEAIDERSGKEH